MTRRYFWRASAWWLTLLVWMGMIAEWIPTPSWYGEMLTDPGVRTLNLVFAVTGISANMYWNGLVRGSNGYLSVQDRLTLADARRRADRRSDRLAGIAR